MALRSHWEYEQIVTLHEYIHATVCKTDTLLLALFDTGEAFFKNIIRSESVKNKEKKP